MERQSDVHDFFLFCTENTAKIKRIRGIFRNEPQQKLSEKLVNNSCANTLCLLLNCCELNASLSLMLTTGLDFSWPQLKYSSQRKQPGFSSRCRLSESDSFGLWLQKTISKFCYQQPAVKQKLDKHLFPLARSFRYFATFLPPVYAYAHAPIHMHVGMHPTLLMLGIC